MNRKGGRHRGPWIGAIILTMVPGLTVLTFCQQGGRLADTRDSLRVPILTFGPQGPSELERTPDDWSHHHLVFSNPGTEQEALDNGTHDRWQRIVNDPRYIMQQMERRAPAQGPLANEVARINEKAKTEDSTAAGIFSAPEASAIRGPALAVLGGGWGAPIAPGRPLKPRSKLINMQEDWNEALGAASAPAYISHPAKWSFSTTSASCADDFVIFPTGQAGASSRASIIAYYNLYSGCGATVPGVDWAYNTGGTVNRETRWTGRGRDERNGRNKGAGNRLRT